MHHANECIRPHTKRKVDAAPERLRRGIFWDSRAGQYGTRIGNSIDEQTGRVGRSNVQRLGADPDAAILEHAKLSAAWKDLKARWPEIMPTLRMKLPGDLGNKAQIEKPFWLLPQWEQDARIENTTGLLNTVDAVKDALKQEQAELLPADLQARLFAALQPPIHETMGFTVDAERLTIEQVRTRYLDDMRSRIGLPEDGIKPGTYRNADRMTRLALAVTVKVVNGQPVLALDPKKMMHEVSRDDLVAFKRAWLAKVTAGEVAKRTAANYCKSVQFLFAWAFKRERIVTRRIVDLEDVFRFSGCNPINIADYESVKQIIKTIITTASARVRLFVYLGLNCGHYQVDVGNLKLGEIEEVNGDTFIVRGRDKTSHQNNFKAKHYLWPETAKLLKAHLASANPKENPGGLALLNEDGGPLYSSDAVIKNNSVARAYWRAIVGMNEAAKKENPKHEPITLPFKQYRKIGATAMFNIGGEQVQKLYRTTAFEGADRFYVRGDFSMLTAALKKWRMVLKRDGILF